MAVHLALLTVSLLFGANYVVAKLALREVTPLDLVMLRTAGAAAVLFAASALPGRVRVAAPLTRSDVARLVLYSLLGATINQLCFLGGLARTTATNASLMLVTIPLMTLALAALLGRERATPRGVLGIVIGLAGALVLLLPRGHVDFHGDATIGNLMLLTGSAAYALYLVLTRDILAHHDPLRVVSWVFLFAALTVLPFAVTGTYATLRGGISAAGWASIAFVVVGATVLPYLLNSWALVRVKSTVVAVYILLQPVVAVSMGRLVLHEQLGPHTAIAAVLVITGVAISASRRG